MSPATRVVTTFSGNGTRGYVEGEATSAEFCSPHGLTTDGSKLLVCDRGNYAIQVIR